jgi:hypothetical protein
MGDCWLFRHLAVENEDLQMYLDAPHQKFGGRVRRGRWGVAELAVLDKPYGWPHRKFRLKISLSKKAAAPFFNPRFRPTTTNRPLQQPSPTKWVLRM